MATLPLPDGTQMYYTDKKTRKELERENFELWHKVQDLEKLLRHQPPSDARIIEPVSLEEFTKLEEYLARVAIPLLPSIDGEEMSYAYKDIEDRIVDLAVHWVTPYSTDQTRAWNMVNEAIRYGTASEVIRWIISVPDIGKLSRYDEDGSLVIRTIVSRWLHLEIFSKGLAGILPQVEELFDSRFLRRRIIPRRSTLERRRWYQLMYAGVMAHPQYQEARETRQTQLAKNLEKLFSFLHPNTSTYSRVLSEIVAPAISLQERVALTIQRHEFRFTHFHEEPDTASVREFVVAAESAFNCEDVTRNCAEISITEQERERLVRNIVPICSVSPIITFEDPETRPATMTLPSRGLVMCTNGHVPSTTKPSFFFDFVRPLLGE